MPHIFVLILVIALCIALWTRIEKRRQAVHAVDESRARCRRAISMDPRAIQAYAALGDSLEGEGRFAEARDVYSKALASCAGQEGIERLRDRLSRLDTRIPQSGLESCSPHSETVLCSQCGETNAPTDLYCRNCHQRVSYERFRDALMDKEVHWATAEAALCLLVLVAVLWTFESLPIDVKGALTCSALLVGGWRFLKAIG